MCTSCVRRWRRGRSSSVVIAVSTNNKCHTSTSRLNIYWLLIRVSLKRKIQCTLDRYTLHRSTAPLGGSIGGCGLYTVEASWVKQGTYIDRYTYIHNSHAILNLRTKKMSLRPATSVRIRTGNRQHNTQIFASISMLQIEEQITRRE